MLPLWRLAGFKNLEPRYAKSGIIETGPFKSFISPYILLAAIIGCQGGCSAEQVYLQLQQQQSGLSLATIYRVLTELEQAKLIERQYHQRAKASFLIRHQRTQFQILHLQNGQVEAFEHQDLSNYLKQLADAMQQQLVKVELTLHVQPKVKF
ncbi:transcriptional repressor [Acinetobacter zhairhuonensis]|uniref:transcriptional repressor n=1 Tax=Acinetobacter sp. A7.4 TaxID=2919921 RepID=UPI001F50330F|nr:transcriptional repressor [Acinetobacter sp. A7.4]MCJ8161502.1 transcriptional repressor [Acinetobacter sp. A7.4]